MTKTEKLAMDVQTVLGDEFTCQVVTERKNNFTLHGIAISEGDSKDTIIVYPNFEEAETEEELIDFVIECFKTNESNLEKYKDLSTKLLDWNYAKDKIYLRIVGDREYAEKYIYWTIEKLYAIPYVKINSSCRNSSQQDITLFQAVQMILL